MDANEFIAERTKKWERERDLNEPVVRTKDIGRRGWVLWARRAWTFQIQTNFPVKVNTIERLQVVKIDGQRYHPGGVVEDDSEYRIGYWIMGGYGKGIGQWRWGQYSLLIPVADLGELLRRATAEGTILAS